MIAFCTLFDSRYLSRGLALHESLTRTTPDAHLFIFPFDDEALRILRGLDLRSATIVPLSDFEDAELLAVKPLRSPAEYCFTCTPSIIRYCIQTFELDACTYVDADLYFFSDARPLLDEMGSADTMLIEHRYSPQHDRSKTSGIYNVQFMPFRSTQNGMKILEWWRNACIDTCKVDYANGFFGDQKYLDDWPRRFAGVHVLKNLGGGVAPWNVQQFRFEKSGARIVGQASSQQSFDLVFYHFHAMSIMANGRVQPTGRGYEFDQSALRLIYLPYISAIAQIDAMLRRLGVVSDVHGQEAAPPFSVRSLIAYAVGRWLKNANRPVAFR